MQDETGKVGESLTSYFKGFGLFLKGDRKSLKATEQQRGLTGYDLKGERKQQLPLPGVRLAMDVN